MWRRSDSKRFVPSDINRRFRAASFHDPEHDRARRRAALSGILLDGFGASRIGRTRRVNQDQFFMVPLVGDDTGLNVFLGVADGIGGAPGGEDASLAVVETITRFVREESAALLRGGHQDGEVIQILRRGLNRCHAELQSIVDHHPEFSGMGTTLTAGLVLWPHLYVAHLGDARVYLLREGGLRRLTQDHTYGQALLEAGVLNEKTIKTSAMRNVLSKYISGDEPEKDSEVHPDIRLEILNPGDTLFFCTDGLTQVLPDEALADILSSDRPSQEACETLMDRSRDLEARDDATALVVRFARSVTPPASRRKSKDTGE